MDKHKAKCGYEQLNPWYTITLVLKDFSEIPLFIAGQFEPKDWFSGWMSSLQTHIYQKLGLVEDVDALCLKVLESLTNSFKQAAFELPLV